MDDGYIDERKYTFLRLRHDSWANALTGVGVEGFDKCTGATYTRTMFDPYMFNELYHGDDMFGRICDKVPEEMTREWIDLPKDTDGKLAAECARLQVREKFCEALV